MDLQKITSEIIARGLTQQQLADLVPCSQSLINALLQGKRGKRPSFEIGRRLLDIHAAPLLKKKAASRGSGKHPA